MCFPQLSLNTIFLKFSIWGKMSKNALSKRKLVNYLNSPHQGHQFLGNLILFHMTPILLHLDVSVKFYVRKLEFNQNHGHFGRNLGFRGFWNIFSKVNLLNIGCYTLSLKISLVYIVCKDGNAKIHVCSFAEGQCTLIHYRLWEYMQEAIFFKYEFSSLRHYNFKSEDGVDL